MDNWYLAPSFEKSPLAGGTPTGFQFGYGQAPNLMEILLGRMPQPETVQEPGRDITSYPVEELIQMALRNYLSKMKRPARAGRFG